MPTAIEIAIDCYKREIPFFIYRKPYETKIVLGIQLTQPRTVRLGQDNIPHGFIFAPFHLEGVDPTYLFEPDHYIINEGDYIEGKADKADKADKALQVVVSRDTYLDDCKRLIDQIQEDPLLKKVVLSRIETRTIAKERDQLFTELLKYQTACCFWIYIPNQVEWMGATPETLIKGDLNMYQTMSLAGTQRWYENIAWRNKEIEEQAIVTDYICDKLGQIGYSAAEIQLQGPATTRAGILAHLATTIKFAKKETIEWESIVEVLHPTPAVCGYPNELALAAIANYEHHNRRYYSGFLGPIDEEGVTHLFVNLRSMELFNQEATIFVGGGITKDSDPTEEWNETTHKLEIMNSITD